MAVSIFGYSGAYVQNANAKSVTQGAQGSGPTGAALQIYEPKIAWPEKAGDSPYEVITCSIPTTRFDGTALVAGDQYFFAPLGAGVKVTALVLNITTAATGGTITMNLGNNTSATAYASGVNLAATGATTPTVIVLNAASVGVGANDAVVGAIAAGVSLPTGTVAATLNLQYGVS